jgi:hypothetical protein
LSSSLHVPGFGPFNLAKCTCRVEANLFFLDIYERKHLKIFKIALILKKKLLRESTPRLSIFQNSQKKYEQKNYFLKKVPGIYFNFCANQNVRVFSLSRKQEKVLPFKALDFNMLAVNIFYFYTLPPSLQFDKGWLPNFLLLYFGKKNIP